MHVDRVVIIHINYVRLVARHFPINGQPLGGLLSIDVILTFIDYFYIITVET